jgi:hypothetical protein
MLAFTLLLAIINHWLFPIDLLIIFTPLILGSAVAILKSMIQLGIVFIVWILILMFMFVGL